MIIPKSIMIGGHKVEIKLENRRELEKLGDFDIWFDLIRINNDGLSEDRQAETFLHEIFEAITTFYNIEIEHQSLTTISEVLFSIIRQNNLDFRTPKKITLKNARRAAKMVLNKKDIEALEALEDIIPIDLYQKFRERNNER